MLFKAQKSFTSALVASYAAAAGRNANEIEKARLA